MATKAPITNTGNVGKGYYVKLDGYRYLRRELRGRYGDTHGKELFKEYKGDVKRVFDSTLIPKAKSYAPRKTGQLRKSIKIRVLANRIYVASGTKQGKVKAIVQYYGRDGASHTTRGWGGFRKIRHNTGGPGAMPGKYWTWRAWQRRQRQVGRQMDRVLAKYGRYVGREFDKAAR